MTQNVQVALAETTADAEEIQVILSNAGISSELEPAVEGDAGDVPQKVLVDESELEIAREAIEAMTEPDELTGD